MKFSDLPPELFQAILNGENSWAAIELWKTGDRALNAKLANSGVTRVDLVDNHGDSTSRWPRCLTSFKLEHLSIIRISGTLYDAASLRSELQQLHPGLRSLQICAECIMDAVFPNLLLGPDDSDADADNVDRNGKLPKSSDASRGADASSTTLSSEGFESEPSSFRPSYPHDDTVHREMWDLGVTWPSLERLTLGNSHRQHDRFMTQNNNVPALYGARMLALLPRSLTRLTLISATLKPVLALMPPALKTLRLSHGSLSSKDLHQLPPSITDITRSVSAEGLAYLSEHCELLPSLRCFPISDLNDEKINSSLFTRPIYAHEREWPDTMLALRRCKTFWQHAPESDLAPFPKALTLLHANSLKIDASAVQSLPRGLRSLMIADVSDWKGFLRTDWPSSLTELLLENSSGFELDCFCMLPRGLKNLAIEYHDDDDDSSDDSVYSYTNFDYDQGFGDGDKNDGKNDVQFEALCALGREALASDNCWASMEQEILRRGPSIPAHVLGAYFDAIRTGRLLGLPLTLTKLSITHLSLLCPIDSKLLLPPHVTHFEYEQFGSVDSNLFRGFPPTSLLYLQVTRKGPIKSMFKYRDGSEISSYSLCALHETSTLTSLSLTVLPPSGLAGAIFKYLPRTLRKLEFSRVSMLSKKFACNARELEDLPRGLESFEFAGVLINGMVRWVHYLPRTLTTLSATRIPLMGCHFKSLPPKLTDLCCSFFEVSLPQVMDLPRSLASLSVGNTGGFKSTSTRHALTHDACWAMIGNFRPFWRIWEAGMVGVKVELSIAWRKEVNTPRSHHTGTKEFCIFPGSYRPHEDKASNKGHGNSADKYDYTDADVERYMVDENLRVDPRTTRRLTGHL